RRLSFMRGLDENYTFPQMTPSSGRIRSMTVTVTEALTEDVVVVDATGILAASGNVSFDMASSATIEMSTQPTMAVDDQGSPPAPVETDTVSLFQAGSVALR